MRYSDFENPKCSKCGDFFDHYTESVLLSVYVEPIQDDEDEYEVVGENICWETSKILKTKNGEAELFCSRCGTLWHSKMKD